MRVTAMLSGLLYIQISLACSCVEVGFEANIVSLFENVNLVAEVEVVEEMTSIDAHKYQSAILKVLNIYKGSADPDRTIEVSGLTIGTMCGRLLAIGERFVYYGSPNSSGMYPSPRACGVGSKPIGYEHTELELLQKLQLGEIKYDPMLHEPRLARMRENKRRLLPAPLPEPQ